jgi:hypothetical protein
MSTIPEVIAQWRAKEISGTAMMRALVSYPEWVLRISDEAVSDAIGTSDAPSLQISKTHDGATCLQLFSSSDALHTYRQAMQATGSQNFLKTNGSWVFHLNLDGIDQLWVDPLSPYDIFYPKELYGALRDIADAVDVEAALAGLRKGTAPDNAIKTAREYKNYSMAVYMHHDRPAFVMAPDEKGRSLAAAFTSADTFDAFLPQAREMVNGAEVQQMQVDGEALFDTFRRMSIDGYVFNCSGPIPAVAFAQAAAEYMLEGAG